MRSKARKSDEGRSVEFKGYDDCTYKGRLEFVQRGIATVAYDRQRRACGEEPVRAYLDTKAQKERLRFLEETD